MQRTIWLIWSNVEGEYLNLVFELESEAINALHSLSKSAFYWILINKQPSHIIIKFRFDETCSPLTINTEE